MGLEALFCLIVELELEVALADFVDGVALVLAWELAVAGKSLEPEPGDTCKLDIALEGDRAQEDTP